MLGTVFDIKEFALNDGGGIRTTVFLKGCPLRCIWCHNPEGLSRAPQLYVRRNGCRNCGLCRVPCEHEDCKPYGRCLHVCPADLLTVSGKVWDAGELALHLLKSKDTLAAMGGGVTLSGGEPLMQADFAYEILSALRGRINLCIETSGFADNATFSGIAKLCDFVIMDIKLADSDAHKLYTGVDNKLIIQNLKWLKESGIPHLFRTPLIPGITDTEENLLAISELVGDDKIELLSYNTLAPAKYPNVGLTFTDKIHQTSSQPPDLSVFKNATVRGLRI